MESLESIRNRVKSLIDAEIYDDGLDLMNDDGEGIVLDSTGYADIVGGGEQEFNIEVRTIYPSLFADTNIGHINLADMIADEDDWYTIEDAVTDCVGEDENKTKNDEVALALLDISSRIDEILSDLRSLGLPQTKIDEVENLLIEASEEVEYLQFDLD